MIGEQAALGADGLITAKTTVASPPADPNDVKYAPMTMEQMYEAEVHEYQVLTEELKDQLRQAANVIHQLQAENTNVSNQLIIARRKVAVYDTFFKHDGPVSASVTARCSRQSFHPIVVARKMPGDMMIFLIPSLPLHPPAITWEHLPEIVIPTVVMD